MEEEVVSRPEMKITSPTLADTIIAYTFLVVGALAAGGTVYEMSDNHILSFISAVGLPITIIVLTKILENTANDSGEESASISLEEQ